MAHSTSAARRTQLLTGRRHRLRPTILSNWYLTGLDVRNAYLYGELEEELYMEQPEGFKVSGQEHKVCLLIKALYGLKQAGLVWWRTLDKFMESLGFTHLKSDAGVFYKYDDRDIIIVIIYVDDAIFGGPNKVKALKAKAEFMKKWDCCDLGELTEFLRMSIERHSCQLHIHQRTYLDKVLQRCGMQNCTPAKTPLPDGYILLDYKGPVDPAHRSKYQMVIGSLLYLMLGTRLDISFAVTKLAQHSANLSDEHLQKVLYICRYLKGTREYQLVFDGATQQDLAAYTDADWAGGAFSWSSRTQKTVAHSVMESEYMALSDCSRQVVWIWQLLNELGLPLKPTPISVDNQSAIFTATNSIMERRSKHIDIRYHYICEVIERNEVEVLHIAGEENPADMFTKNLGHVKHHKFREAVGLHFAAKTARSGHKGANSCRLYCGQQGRLKLNFTHYYPACLKPLNYEVPSSSHPDIDLHALPTSDAPSPTQRYYSNLRKLMSVSTLAEYKEVRRETGIFKPSIFLGFPSTQISLLPGCFLADIMHLVSLNLPDLLLKLWRGTFECDRNDDKSTWDWELQEAHCLLVEFCEEYEVLYYRRLSYRLHFVRYSMHALIHAATESYRIGPHIYFSQWTLERLIGQLVGELRQPSNPYRNLSERALRRAQASAIKAMVPELERVPTLPRGAIDLGGGFSLRRACDSRLYRFHTSEVQAFHEFESKNPIRDLDSAWYESPAVWRWARVGLPTAQIARSMWCEEKRQNPRISRNIKYMNKDHAGRLISAFGEVQYYFQVTTIHGFEGAYAMVKIYSDPDSDLYQESSGALWACRRQEACEVVPVKRILYEGQVFIVEKMGLDVMPLLEGGAEPDEEDQ
ncbi:hypothetical protein NM688_g6215 [Phlebia brevispora]|uniref:Uncharacterized protein n=1 Tax=Phlebia brevispora TaxID=194682 RepID=A0ACC1SIL3_9APHY|nr:hypothetical protein NM688_g6215 [Phlebia brevispora]